MISPATLGSVCLQTLHLATTVTTSLDGVQFSFCVVKALFSARKSNASLSTLG